MEKNFDLLKQLYEIFSPSMGEKKMRKFIKKYCVSLGANVEQDAKGNLYVTKGQADEYPCVVAHMDQVQYNHSKDFTVAMFGDCIMAFSEKSRAQQGLGADDKNGIWIALHILNEMENVKCAFFVGEEIGCVGSSDADMDFFKDVRFVVQADRRNGGDLITDISGPICSQEFLNDINYERFGYKPTYGLTTDVETLCSKGIGVSCINVSCGYYDPHTDHETTSWKELCNALDFVEYICKNCTKRYVHEYDTYPEWGRYSTHIYHDFAGLSDKNESELWDADGSCDYDMMKYILYDQPHLSFDEVMDWYRHDFMTKNKETLKKIYDKAHEAVMEEYESYNGKYWYEDDDDDVVCEIVTKKAV